VQGVGILGCMEDIPLDGAIIRPYVDLNLETLYNVRVTIMLSTIMRRTGHSAFLKPCDQPCSGDLDANQACYDQVRVCLVNAPVYAIVCSQAHIRMC